MRNAGGVSRFAAWAILVLLVLAPLTLLLTVNKASRPAWIVWAIASLCAALKAAPLTTLILPEYHSPTPAVAFALLAIVNMALSVCLVLVPTTWLTAFR